jgi:hypothetical protein
MANREHLAILKRGVDEWNRWRKTHPMERPNLSEADLSGANLSRVDVSPSSNTISVDLSGANLARANLTRANLCGARLSAAYLDEANLKDANLTGANLSESKLSLANLSGATLVSSVLIGADLSGANLTLSDLREADFAGAHLRYTILANVYLGLTKGLEMVIHDGPSSIGIDTIYWSKGRIPNLFLRGAGVPEFFIENMTGLVGTGIEFYSLFISYSTKDKEFVYRLHNDLQAKGVRCWKDDHNMRGGKKVHEQIDRAIQMQDKLLLILSPASMTSEWVKSEIAKARKREVQEKRQILFPIRLCDIELIKKWEYFDSDIGKDSAREIREYHIPDFSNWTDPAAYRKAFDKLLRDLQGEPKPA